MFKKRPSTQKEHDREVKEGLTAIFGAEGETADLKTFAPRRSRWWLYAVAAVMLFAVALIGAAWAGFSIFKPFKGFSGQGLAIVVEGPERVSLGQELVYFVNYQNRTSEPLTDVRLKISFPSDFVASGFEPEPDDGMVWKIGDVPVDGRGTVKVRGTFTGAIGTATAIQVVGTYDATGIGGGHDALATKLLTYSDSVLSGALETPMKVLPGDHVVLTYRLQNRGNEDFESLYARLSLPDGFELGTSTTAVMDGRNAVVSIGTIPAGSSSTVMLEGVFASGAAGEAHVVAEAGRKSADGSFLPSARSETSFTVLAGDLSLKLVLNGQDKDVSIHYGSTLRFTIGYENTAPENLEDVRLRFRLEAAAPTSTSVPQLVNWNTLIETASATRAGDELIWDKNAIAAFERLPSREEGSISFSLGALPATSGTEALVLRAIVEAEVGSVGTTKVDRIVRSSPILLTYLTDADISSDARYFSEEGAPIGSGPLPPVVGQKTVYRVGWKVEKHFHELKDIRMKAVLPSNVRWTGDVVDSAGEIAFDEKTRTVTWSLNRMPANVDEETIAFDIEVTPGEADADRFVKLLGETRFEAVDTVTGENVVRTRPALTSDLENDESASGKGVVRKP